MISWFKRGAKKAPDQAADENPLSWRAAHVSIVGASHVRNRVECQDRSDSDVLDSGRWAYVIVADGHGSDRHFRSARGADFAVRALREVFVGFPDFVRELEAEAKEAKGPTEATAALSMANWSDAARLVVSNWRTMVHTDLIDDPPAIPSGEDDEPGVKRFLDKWRSRKGDEHIDRVLLPQLRAFETYAAKLRAQQPDRLPPLPLPSDPQWDQSLLGSWQARAYGTTLLGVLIGPEALYWLQLGDGAMVQVVGEGADYLVPPPSEAIANETPSICDDHAASKIRLGTVPIVAGAYPSALILVTDGVPNSYEDGAGFFKFCQDLADRATTTEDVTANLERWLPAISQQGSGDDMSVALIWDPETTGRRSPAIVGPAATPPAEAEGDPPDPTTGCAIDDVLNPSAAGTPENDTGPTADRRTEQEPDHAGNG